MEDGMRILALAESVDHVSGRYRVRSFAAALEAAGCSLTVEGVERPLLARLRQIERAAEYDAVLVQRKLLPGWQLDRLRRRARRLVFDFDDAILYRDSNDPRGPDSPRRLRRFRRVVGAADMVVAGNAFLAGLALGLGAAGRSIRVIPTCIDTSRYREAGRTLTVDGIDLAWIGSSGTLAGLESRRDLWERVGREVAGARLRVICDRFPDFGPLAVVPVAWSGATEAEELARADAGVSYLPDDLWSRGKCGLKVLQCQAAGLPVVANPVGVQPTMVEDGVNGLLAATADEWVAAVRALRDDPGRRAEMGRAARRAIEGHYSVAAWSSAFVSAVTGRANARPTHVRPGVLTNLDVSRQDRARGERSSAEG